MLHVETKGSVARVTIQRPEVRNALSDTLIAQLTEAFSKMPSAVRAVILTGADPAFCAGGDLEWMRKAAGYSTDQNYQDALLLAELFDLIVQAPYVVIGRVNGHAFGGGAGLVACCDVAVGSKKALFSFSEVKLGLVAATISPHVISKIGSGNARWLFSTGEVFDADTALRIGLLHGVAELDELDGLVNQKLQAILKAGPQAVALSKRIARSPGMDIEIAARMLAEVRAGGEAKEGVSAFLEKRAASFCEESK